MNAFEKTAKILAEYKGVDVQTIKPESTFKEVDLDSLDIAELVMNLEDEFGIAIDLDEDVKCVSDLVSRIEEAK